MRLAWIVVVAGCATKSNAPSPIAWSPPVEIAQGGGTKGPWQQNNSQFDYVDDPTVALAPDGAAAVVWTDHRTKDIYFQVYDSEGRARLAKPTNISRTPEVFSWLPRIVLAGSDVYVLWQEIVFSGGSHGGETLFARSHDGGATFEPAINLSQSRAGDGKGRLDAKTWDNGSLDLARAADGTLIAAWTEYDGPLWVSRSTDRGATFESPRQVGGSPERPARAPALATRGDAVYLAWTVGEDRSADIRVASSRDGGRIFDEPVIVARTTGYSDAPKLAVDSAGTLHLVFAEDGEVFYSRSRDSGFDVPRKISRPHPGRAVAAGFPALVIEGERMYASWELFEAGAEMPRGIALAYSLDGGATFGAPAIVAGSADPGGGWNGSHQGKLMQKLAVRGSQIVVVNSALEHGDHSRVWLVRGTHHTASVVTARRP